MSQIKKRWVGNDEIGASKIRLENNTALRWRNFLDSSDVDVLKLNASNFPEFLVMPYTPAAAPTQNYEVANKKYVDDSLSGITKKEIITFDGVTPTYDYDLSFVAKTDSITITPDGGPVALEGIGLDYTVNYTGGVGGVTRITLLSRFYSLLVDGDKLYVQYIK